MDRAADLETARAAGAGNRTALERIVRDNYDQVYRLARHLSGSYTEAQDLAQNTFISAYRNIKRFDGRSTLRAWLAGILMHECSHWRRSRRPAGSLQELSSPDPVGQILDREILLNAIHRLPEKHSSTFLLVEVHGFSLAEASSALGIPEGTVKSRLSEAKSKLRSYIGSEENLYSEKVTHEH